MKQLTLGVVIGSVLTAGLGVAADLYNREGAVQAPTGSAQQYDYFRQRQLFLDVQKLRQLGEQGRIESLMRPCAR